MRHYKSESVKPTMILTNNKVFWVLNPGKLRRRKRKGAKPTTRRYKNSQGKDRFAGTSRLKSSQNLGNAKFAKSIKEFFVTCFGKGTTLHNKSCFCRLYCKCVLEGNPSKVFLLCGPNPSRSYVRYWKSFLCFWEGPPQVFFDYSYE